MLDDRTMRRAPKAEALKRWPQASCHQAPDGYVVKSNEAGQRTYIGEGRSAWDAWMYAEVAKRNPSDTETESDE